MKSFLVAGLVLVSAVVWFLGQRFATKEMREAAEYRVDFDSHELAGDEYLRPLAKVLVGSTAHKTLLRAGGAADKVRKVEGEVEAALKHLEAADKKHTDTLLTSRAELQKRGRQDALPSSLVSRWASLAKLYGAADFRAANSDEQHDKFIGDVRALYVHVGDSSKLILDPDLDTYYNMDILLLRSPDILERIGDLADQVYDLIQKKSLDSADRSALAEAIGLIRFHNDNIKADVDTVLNEAPNFSKMQDELRRTLLPQVREAHDGTNALLEVSVEKVLNTPSVAISFAEFDAAVRKAQNLHDKFLEESFDQEDAMIGIRLKYWVQKRDGGASTVRLYAIVAGALSLITVAVALIGGRTKGPT